MAAVLNVSPMKLLFVGDVVGRPGRRILRAILQEIISQEAVDLVIANGENSAGGFGMTMEVCQELLSCGVDVITMGNHTWDNREIYKVLEMEPRVIRPANYPGGTPGQGYYLAQTGKGEPVGVINLLGQVFLDSLDCPFRTADECITALKSKTPVIIVDIHAEATSEKMALGWYLDGKVTAVIGTHTHVATADARILPQGTGYLTDAGMTGPINSVLGIDPELVVKKFLTKLPVRFEIASGPLEFNGVLLDIDEAGKTTRIRSIHRKLEVS